MRLRVNVTDLVLAIGIGIMALLTIFPFYQTFIVSLSTVSDVGTGHILLWPKSIDLSAYQYLFKEGFVTQGLLISILVTVVGTAVNMLVTIAGAYAISKKTLPGRNVILNGIIFTMFFSGGLIPYFLTLQNLHLQNNILVMILPVAVNAFNLILMKNFFSAIPPALEESAKIDGANDISVLIRVVVPVSLPIIATMTLFYAVERWNEWWLAMLFISDPKYYPLQLVLRNAITNLSALMSNSTAAQMAQNSTQIYADSVKAAIIIISAVPILVIYPFIQRFFTQGLLLGSVKG